MSDLTKMCETQEEQMPETVYIQRLTRTSDSAGGASEAWQTQTTTKGRLAQSGGSERLIADRIGAVLTYTITLPAGSDVKQGDRLQINGRNYQVETIIQRSKQTALRVVCVEVV